MRRRSPGPSARPSSPSAATRSTKGSPLLHRAVGLEQDPAAQGSLWYEIGRACALKYDGEGFVAAMEKAVELGAPPAEVYAELGYQTVQRAGMWKTRPAHGLVAGWARVR